MSLNDGEMTTNTYRFVVRNWHAWLVAVDSELPSGRMMTTRLRYDDHRRPVEKTRDVPPEETSTTRFTYDDAGRVSECVTTSPDSTTTSTLAYDDAGRVARVTHGSTSPGSRQTTIWIRYGEDRRPPPRKLVDSDRIYQVQVDTTGRWRSLEDIRVKGSAGTAVLAYNHTGQKIERGVEYTYDDRGRPVNVIIDTRPRGPALHWPTYNHGFRWVRGFDYKGCDETTATELAPWLLAREVALPQSLGCSPYGY